ncbi:cellulase-like family protein [Alloalcanivorax mobilis]|uniref:cellulase-like family protein n=1 Tax=Alloalcanivorax mobilis TaxID=2019569 RepID=UPI000B5B25E2|nr:cellulase-like family protein [Alloalcanivorax mobilis]ASK36577.1 cellulase [Alcanivorax sp. N3-2A]
MTCWDYAWPLCRDYGAVERMLDETRARGFNAVRLDPYPHLLATPLNGVHLDRCEILPEADRRRRIVAGAHTVEIRKAFQRLLGAARDRDIKLWFSGFFVPDSRARRSFVRRPADYVDVWAQTLELARRWGYLDTIVAVDFAHHFPFPPWSHGVTRRLFDRAPQRGLPERWSGEQERAVERYLLEVPRALRALFPQISFGLSAAAGHCEALRQLDTSELDFLDLGVWLDDDPRFRLVSGAGLPVPDALRRRLTAPVHQALLETTGDHWRERIQDQLNRRLAFARLRRLQPVLGEGYLSVAGEPDSPPRRWAAFTEAVVARAVEDGVSVITPTSLARPHTPWLWRQVDWLARLNHLIITGPGR